MDIFGLLPDVRYLLEIVYASFESLTACKSHCLDFVMVSDYFVSSQSRICIYGRWLQRKGGGGCGEEGGGGLAVKYRTSQMALKQLQSRYSRERWRWQNGLFMPWILVAYAPCITLAGHCRTPFLLQTTRRRPKRKAKVKDYPLVSNRRTQQNFKNLKGNTIFWRFWGLEHLTENDHSSDTLCVE